MKQNRPCDARGLRCSVFFDGTHLVAEDPDELHRFAQSIGLRRHWFQDNPQADLRVRHPHYDITSPVMRKRAFSAGAIAAAPREILAICRRCAKRLQHQEQVSSRVTPFSISEPGFCRLR
jgi:hypothetical protein